MNTAIAAGYAALGVAFLSLASFGVSAPLWPPAGLAFAAAIVWRWKAAPGILLGSLLANTIHLTLTGTPSVHLLTATAIGLGAALQAVLGAALTRPYLRKPSPLSSVKDILLFLMLAGPVASMVNATVGTATQVAAGVIPAERADLAWLIWWAGDAMGVIVFGPIFLMFLPDKTGLWRGWRLRVGVPSAVFAAVLMTEIMASVSAESGQLETQREQAVQDASALILNQLDQEREVLLGIRDLFNASKNVSAREFRIYTSDPLQRFTSLKALSWNTSLTSDELGAFLAERRSQPGGADFTATQRDAEGELRPVRPGRAQYVVVTYIEPIAQNRDALGFDIASDPKRMGTIDRAQTTGQISATPPIDLVQDSGGTQKGMLVLNPVYDSVTTPSTAAERRAGIRGFAVGVYEIGDMVHDVFGTHVDTGRWNDVSIELLDITDAANPVTLATHGTLPTNATDTTVIGAPMNVMGRTWQLELTPVSGPLSEPPLGASPYLLLAALAGLLLLEGLLISLATREREAQSEAAERSHEANHDSLTGLLNRRGFLTRLEQVCDNSTSSTARSVLLFCDLDRFKQVNDAAGHLAGDDMLVAVADLLRQHVRHADVVARLGGDEFAVILIDCPSEQALRIATSMVDAIEGFRLPTAVGDVCVGVSMGAAFVGGDLGISPDEALRRSDSAAYEAKASNDGRVRLFTAPEPAN